MSRIDDMTRPAAAPSRPFCAKALCLLALAMAPAARADFVWTDTPGKFLELSRDDKPVARFVYEPLDESSPARREETFKPFCHLYFHQWNHYGNLLTKGPGGKFTHHRGVFYGFNNISYKDSSGARHEKIDTWHCRKAYQIHRRFTAREAGAERASFTSEIDWVGDDGAPFATEARTMGFSFDGPDLFVDFVSVLTPRVERLRLDGDPQHAGFHFRAHNDVNDRTAKATYFIRAETGIGKPGIALNWSEKNDTEQTRDQSWKAMCFTLRDTQVTVIYLDHPDNPKPARSSERTYGRFGTYFATECAPDAPLSVRYRLVVHPGEFKEPKDLGQIEQWSEKFVATP